MGTMTAIALSSVIYMVLAYWLARSATTEELISNYTILIDRAAWRPIVLAGLLGATFSSALASLVGAPRILSALGEHSILPGSSWFAARTPTGEPRNSMWVTGALVLGALLIRDLNAIAPLISLFFLITYGMINFVVLIEQTLGLVSFRPTLKIPRIVPLIGAIGCIFAMFIENPTFSLIAVMFVILIYGVLLQQKLHAPFGDVRSGLFGAISEWAARKVSNMPVASERTWQPNLVVPVETPYELRGSFRFLYSIARPKGSIKVLGLTTGGDNELLAKRLPILADTFRRQKVFTTWAIMEASSFGVGVTGGMQALRSSYLNPNTVFLTMPRDSQREEDLRLIIEKARANNLGVLLFAPHPAAGLGLEKSINLWMYERSPDWSLQMQLGNLDLSLLLGYLLQRNWSAQLNLITIVPDADQIAPGTEFLVRLAELARLPKGVELIAAQGQFPDYVT